MPEQETVKLKTGFEIAHRRLEEIKAALIASGVIFNCCDRSQLFKAAADPDYKVAGSSAVALKKHDLLNNNGCVKDEETANVVVSAANYDSMEEAKASLEETGASCPVLNLENLAVGCH